MNAPLIMLLGLQAIVFVAFIILAFRWLFALRREAVARSGSTLPGLSATLAAFRSGLADPRYAGMRWGIAGCALVLATCAFLAPDLMLS